MGGLPTRRTVNGFTTDPKDARVMYAALLQGLFISRNGGQTWVLASSTLKNLASVVVHPKRPEEIYVATRDGKIFQSLDGGKSWKQQEMK